MVLALLMIERRHGMMIHRLPARVNLSVAEQTASRIASFLLYKFASYKNKAPAELYHKFAILNHFATSPGWSGVILKLWRLYRARRIFSRNSEGVMSNCLEKLRPNWPNE